MKRFEYHQPSFLTQKQDPSVHLIENPVIPLDQETFGLLALLAYTQSRERADLLTCVPPNLRLAA